MNAQQIVEMNKAIRNECPKHMTRMLPHVEHSHVGDCADLWTPRFTVRGFEDRPESCQSCTKCLIAARIDESMHALKCRYSDTSNKLNALGFCTCI